MKRLKNRYTIILLIILILGAVFRLYRISEYMTFLGDEGRDALTAWGILHGHFTLLGPRSSAANFFYGPIYFYLITPFLWLFRYDPVGPAIMVALFGVATVWLIYRVGREFFGPVGALISAGLYSIAPMVIIYSRSSWNPNILPFFALLSLYLTYKGIEKRSPRFFLVVGVLLGISIQLHYLALFLSVVIVVYLFAGFFLQKTHELTFLIKSYVLMLIGWLVGISPFLAFEIRHGFPNTKTIFGFIFMSVENTQQIVQKQPFFVIVFHTLQRLFIYDMAFFPQNISSWSSTTLTIWYIFSITVAIAGFLSLFKMKNRLQMLMLLLWLVIGIVLYGFYKKNIYDYLLEFLFPLPFLMIGNLSNVLIALKKLSVIPKAMIIVILLGFIMITYFNNPMFFQANNLKGQAQKVAEFVLSKADGKPFNFALITTGDSDYAYRYYFQIEGNSPVTIQNTTIDPNRKSVTGQLFAVCEGLAQCPNPLGDPLWEVAGFGRAEIAGEWEPIPKVIRVYKLKHYTEK